MLMKGRLSGYSYITNSWAFQFDKFVYPFFLTHNRLVGVIFLNETLSFVSFVYVSCFRKITNLTDASQRWNVNKKEN